MNTIYLVVQEDDLGNSGTVLGIFRDMDSGKKFLKGFHHNYHIERWDYIFDKNTYYHYNTYSEF